MMAHPAALVLALAPLVVGLGVPMAAETAPGPCAAVARVVVRMAAPYQAGEPLSAMVQRAAASAWVQPTIEAQLAVRFPALPVPAACALAWWQGDYARADGPR